MNEAVDASQDPHEALQIAHAVMGNRTKSSIVRHLWTHGPSTGTAICRSTGISAPTFSLAMQQLEKWNLTTGSIPSHERHGRAVTYVLDHDRVQALVNLWLNYVQGHDLSGLVSPASVTSGAAPESS